MRETISLQVPLLESRGTFSAACPTYRSPCISHTILYKITKFDIYCIWERRTNMLSLWSWSQNIITEKRKQTLLVLKKHYFQFWGTLSYQICGGFLVRRCVAYQKRVTLIFCLLTQFKDKNNLSWLSLFAMLSHLESPIMILWGIFGRNWVFDYILVAVTLTSDPPK